MSGAPVLSLAHQVVVNSLGFLLAQVVEDDRWPMVLDALPEALAKADRAHPMTDRLCSAAQLLVDLAPLRRDPARAGDWAYAVLQAQAAVAEVFWWRGGLALDALRNPSETRGEPAR